MDFGTFCNTKHNVHIKLTLFKDNESKKIHLKYFLLRCCSFWEMSETVSRIRFRQLSPGKHRDILTRGRFSSRSNSFQIHNGIIPGHFTDSWAVCLHSLRLAASTQIIIYWKPCLWSPLSEVTCLWFSQPDKANTGIWTGIYTSTLVFMQLSFSI